MADCKIVNEKVASSVTAIQGLAKEYATAGSDFESAFKAAIAEMEGDSKDAGRQTVLSDQDAGKEAG